MTAGWEMWAWPAVMAAGDGGLERLRCSCDQAVLTISPGRSSQPVSPCRASPTKECRSSSRAGRRCNIERPVLIWVSVAVVTPANATSHAVPDMQRALEWWGVSKSVTKVVAGAECA